MRSGDLGEAELDEADWLALYQAALARRRAPTTATIACLPASDARSGGPFRVSDGGPRVVASSRPPPRGFDAIEYDGQTYYRHRIHGRAYTAGDIAARTRTTYEIVLGGPNEQLAGYETIEIKTARMARGEIRWRSTATGASYTAEMIASGDAAAQECFLRRPPAAAPGRVGRLLQKLLGAARFTTATGPTCSSCPRARSR